MKKLPAAAKSGRGAALALVDNDLVAGAGGLVHGVEDLHQRHTVLGGIAAGDAVGDAADVVGDLVVEQAVEA